MKLKMNYRVAELPHLFFNRALPEGARAGAYAHYSDGVLYHDQREAAAAFLIDASGPDGKPAAVIFPNASDGRWWQNNLARAVPETVENVLLQAWPSGAYMALKAGVRTVADIAAAYTAAIGIDCEKAAHSANDAAGTEPVSVPRYVEAVNGLLALQWNDAGKREAARAALAAMVAAWGLSDGGAYNLDLVRAISQRRKIEKAAAENAEHLTRYFAERKNSKAGLRDRVAFIHGHAEGALKAAAAIARAGWPAGMMAGIPTNAAAAIMADTARAARAVEYMKGANAARLCWAGRGVDVIYSSLGKMYAESCQAAATYRQNKARRDTAKLNIKNAAQAAAEAGQLWPLMQSALAELQAAEPDYSVILAAAGHGANYTFASQHKRALELPQNPRAPIWPAHIDAAELDQAVKTVTKAAAAYRDREKYNVAAADVREKIAAALSAAETMPRYSLDRLQWSRLNASGWYFWNGAPAALRESLEAEAEAARAHVETLKAGVSELAEYENGGNAPASGNDWLLIKGREAVTTRGARVPARAIAAALVFIDRQPAGPFDCREHDIKIGAFQLYGRDHADGVTVGCHYFTAEAVDHIRAQLARGDQAAAAA